jgi:hypothetical protein
LIFGAQITGSRWNIAGTFKIGDPIDKILKQLKADRIRTPHGLSLAAIPTAWYSEL